MAKKLITSYVFTPGVAGAGTVTINGVYALEQFLLITNVTTNSIIYQFDEATIGGTISTGGGNTTLTLAVATDTMSATDRLQIFVDDAAAVEISAVSLPLPSGASTAANQTTANSSLASIDGKIPALVSGRQPVDGSGVTQPISAAALPLPTGAATQATLASVDGKLPALDTGYVPVLVKNGQLEITNDTGNPLPVGTAAQLNVTGSASANNTDLISVACDAYRSVNFQITGTWAGTITFQVSNDNTNWIAVNAIASNGTAAVTTTTANVVAYSALSGVQYFRVRFTAYTSGTATINAYFNRDSVPTATLPGSPTNTVVGSATGSGVTLYTVNSTATTNAANIKSTAANLYGISAMNTSATTKYVRFYSKSTAPTVGTDVPIMVVAVPATSSKEIEYVPALRITTGLGVAITGGAAATDATAVAAGDVQLLVSYA